MIFHSDHHRLLWNMRSRKQSGVGTIEMVVILPILIALIFLIIHSAFLLFAKNQLNHATFMAARAASVNGLNPAATQRALVLALIPMYGGGTDDGELQASRDRAEAGLAISRRILERNFNPPLSPIQVINPSRLSFDDWSEAFLTQQSGRRSIPNSGLEYRGADVGRASLQSIQDANLLRLKVVMAYEPVVPFILFFYRSTLALQRVAGIPVDPLLVAMLSEVDVIGRGGFIPIQATVTVQMQSDALEY